MAYMGAYIIGSKMLSVSNVKLHHSHTKIKPENKNIHIFSWPYIFKNAGTSKKLEKCAFF